MLRPKSFPGALQVFSREVTVAGHALQQLDISLPALWPRRAMRRPTVLWKDE